MTEETGFRFPAAKRDLLIPQRIQPKSKTRAAFFQLLADIFSLEVKWLGREADCSISPSAKVKNAWIYTSTPPATSSWQCLI
jgi:hypothetical protein